jgi:uncharacterized protein with HEPN domain
LSSKAEQWLHDILQSIEVIEIHVADMDFEQFRMDVKTMDAVERRLQTISEAAIRLGPEADQLCKGRALAQYPRHRQLAAPSV